MSQQITLERIGLLGALKFGFVLGAFLALLGGSLFMFLYWIAAAQFSRSPFASALPGFGQVLVSIIIYVIFAAILYAISVWLLAVLYNLIASVSSGLIFQIRGLNLASPAPTPMFAPAPMATPTAVAPVYNTPANAMPPALPNQTPAPTPPTLAAQFQPIPGVQTGAWFIGISNPALRIALTRPVTRIGSAPGNDLVVPSANVAAQHAEICIENGLYIIHDVSNGLGVTVNGRVVQQSNMLKHGFNVALGDATFVFQS